MRLIEKNIIMAIAITTSIVLFLGACSSEPDKGRSNSNSITIELDSNPATGYQWTYTMEPEGIVKETSNKYNANATGAIGGGGKHTFVFDAQSPGEVRLKFIYTRPWETETKPSRTEIYTLNVNSELAVKLVPS